MKIAILTSGILPVPAVQGGAVENLVDFYLQYNELHHLHDITIYSVWHPDVKKHPALKSEVNHYYYIIMNGWWARLKKKIYQETHGKEYYHYTIEYFFEQALKHIKKQQYDIIILENRPGYALKLKNITPAKIVIHQENDYLNSQTKCCNEIYNYTNLIINTSDYITQRVKTIKRDESKCITVHNGINTTIFYNALPYNRQNKSFLEDDFIIVYSGRLTEEKGILQLIRAIKQLQETNNLRLMIVGASAYGKDKQPTIFIKQLEKESESIKDKVIFTGFVSYDKIPSFLKMADLAVVPSMWEEPFGLTVVEAMAAGVPLITTRSGGIPEICEGVATIVERDTIVENLTSAILDLYKHPDKRKKMSEASLKRSKLFDKETYAKNFFAALEELGE